MTKIPWLSDTNTNLTASFQRKVLKSFTLSNGQVIPAGLIIEIPAVAFNSDPSIFPKAVEFDPLRFYKLRTQAKDEGSVEKAANNQFVSVNQSSLTFGYGRHACPGRFFAANEIKVILTHAILRYDVKLVDSETKRYPNMEFAHMVSQIAIYVGYVRTMDKVYSGSVSKTLVQGKKCLKGLI